MISKAIIEIPKNCRYKWEYKNGIFIMDRKLPIKCPQNYGFIPNTLAEDGDALDVFVCSKKTLYMGEAVEIDIIGEYVCLDNGIPDNKLVSIPKDSEDPIDIDPIEKYLRSYKPGFQVLYFKPGFDVSDMMRYVE